MCAQTRASRWDRYQKPYGWFVSRQTPLSHETTIITIRAPWDHGGEAPAGGGSRGGRADLLFLRQQGLRAGTEKPQVLPRRKGVAAHTVRERALPLAMCLHLSPPQIQRRRGDDPAWRQYLLIHAYVFPLQPDSTTEQNWAGWMFSCMIIFLLAKRVLSVLGSPFFYNCICTCI